MTDDREMHKGMGYTCCAPWSGHNHARFRLKVGVLLLLIGFVWYGMRVGWFEVTWFRAIPIGPAIVILIGVCMIYRGLRRRKPFKAENDKEA
jgi:F0F1-type ATP synthase assembly protein I